jgi:serine phosphatase RsbU (regulator of sigma subunit)
MQAMSIDAEQGVASLANAGHPYPVHYSARRKKCDVLPIRGELLHQIVGAEPRSSDYQEYILDIRQGDVVVMITDGLTENNMWQGDPYGYRFTSVIENHADEGARSIADAILHDWRSRKQDTSVGDDVTVMVAVIQPGARGRVIE